MAISVVALAALVAGCGSSNGGASSGGTKRSMEAFTACLKEHGVNLPEGGQPPGDGQPPSGSPPAGGQPPDMSKMQDAFAACGDLAPQRGQGGGFGGPPGGFSNGG